jgi:hypothetical protein
MTEKLTTRAAIEHVLRGKRKPMTVSAIFDEAMPLTALAGKTPEADVLQRRPLREAQG